jgi:prevent-host-death family protein
MKLSVREARAQFAAALAAVEKGERVTITKNGQPVAELGPPTKPEKKGFDWNAHERWRKENGYDKLPPDNRTEEEWFADFNDPIFTDMMLGKYATDDEDLSRS